MHLGLKGENVVRERVGPSTDPFPQRVNCLKQLGLKVVECSSFNTIEYTTILDSQCVVLTAFLLANYKILRSEMAYGQSPRN